MSAHLGDDALGLDLLLRCWSPSLKSPLLPLELDESVYVGDPLKFL